MVILSIVIDSFFDTELYNDVYDAGGNGTRVVKGKKSYENLPSEAKAACDKFVKQGLMTREEYVKEFEWE